MSIRVFEAFAGVGSQRMALRNLGIDHKVVAISDVDEFTIKSYAAIHDSDKTVSEVTDEEMQDYLEERNIPLNDKGVRKILKGKKLKEFYDACIKSNNLGDISKVETHDIPDHDLFTYSFPCQDISVAGKGSGLDEGSDTRSGLLWECQKVIYGKRPKYLLLENVKNLVGKKHKHNFDRWLEWLEKQGYTNYHQILNAKDYGVPQNRERVFVVSILGHHDSYEFPEAIELELRLKDVLEDEVDEKFYLDNPKTQKFLAQLDYVPTEEIKLNQLGNFEKFANPDKKFNDPQTGRVLDSLGICQALDTMQGGNRQPKIVIKNATKKGYLEAKGEFGRMGSQAVETLNENDVKHSDTINPFNKRVSSKDGISPTLTTRPEGFKTAVLPVVDNSNIKPINPLKDKTTNGWHFEQQVYDSDGITRTVKAGGGSGNIPKTIEGLRIRKLTPKECWRLMGFSDDDFHKAEEVNSNSQLYKQAGNSIVVDVLEGIFKQLLEVAE